MAPKTVLVTGCSSGGIGAGLALEFHRQGLTVFAGVRTLSKAADLASAGITVIQMDVTSQPSIAAAVETIKRATGGKLDILVNNAGVDAVMPFLDTAIDDIRRVMDTNVIAVMAVTQAFLPMIMEAKGIVANMGSVVPMFVPPYQTAYVASKAAISAFSDTLRVELKPFGVRVVHIIPGAIRTHLFENARCKLPEGSLYSPLRERIESMEFLGDLEKYTPVDVFAKGVVKGLLKPSPGVAIWIGLHTTTAWVIEKIGWRGIMDYAYFKGLGLAAVKPRET